jgi:hypothetical protein
MLNYRRKFHLETYFQLLDLPIINSMLKWSMSEEMVTHLKNKKKKNTAINTTY